MEVSVLPEVPAAAAGAGSADGASPDLDRIYERRFTDDDIASKEMVWSALGAHLQRYIQDAPVLDVAADRGYFIRHITAPERWATDIRDISAHLDGDIRFVQTSGLEMSQVLPREHFGTVFMSNYLEHLASSEDVVQQLREARAVSRPGGRVVVLQPNIRLVGPAYWDFLDHKTALTETSLVEAAEIAGLTTERVITRFMPFTFKSRLPKSKALVRMYLACPPAWRVLGKQTLYIGRR